MLVSRLGYTCNLTGRTEVDNDGRDISGYCSGRGIFMVVGRKSLIFSLPSVLLIKPLPVADDIISPGESSPAGESSVKRETFDTLRILIAAVDAADHYTYGHSIRVSSYAVAIAERMGLPPERIAKLHNTAELHDIGKIGILGELLNKTGHLTEGDWKLIQAHPALGAAMVAYVDSLAPCLPGIQYHHERYDGSGYLSGLSGEDIPLDARIIAVADAYDAMTSPRPYRDVTLTHEEALEELGRNINKQFDPALVQVFCALRKKTLPERVTVADLEIGPLVNHHAGACQ